MQIPEHVAVDWDQASILSEVQRRGVYGLFESQHEFGNATVALQAEDEDAWVVLMHSVNDGTNPDAGWARLRFPRRHYTADQVRAWMVQALDRLT